MLQFFFILIELCKSCESKQYGTFGNSSLELDIADSSVWVIIYESYRGHGWSTATTISKWTDGESFHVNMWYYKIFIQPLFPIYVGTDIVFGLAL